MASAYREAEKRFEGDEEGFYRYLAENRLDDPTLCLGYWLKNAERYLNLNQSDVAARTGTNTEPPFTRGYLSLLLTGGSNATPATYTRIARACGANPIEFILADKRWGITEADVAAYQLPFAQDWSPVASKLAQVPIHRRRAVVALVAAIIDTIIDSDL